MALRIYPDPLTLLRPVSKIISASYTRPADTTAYAEGDVLANSTSAATILTFPNVARANGLGFLIDGVTVGAGPAMQSSLALRPIFGVETLTGLSRGLTLHTAALGIAI